MGRPMEREGVRAGKGHRKEIDYCMGMRCFPGRRELLM